MKLYEIEPGSKIHCLCPDGSKWITFHHADGSYSVCVTAGGSLCGLYASTDLELRDDGSYDIRPEEVS